MVKLIRDHDEVFKKTIGGRPSALSYEDQVLITLEYLREYRTYFSLGEMYGVSESTAYKIIKKTKNMLIKAEEFILPYRKNLRRFRHTGSRRRRE